MKRRWVLLIVPEIYYGLVLKCKDLCDMNHTRHTNLYILDNFARFDFIPQGPLSTR